MSPNFIPASHLDGAIIEEVTEAQAARYRRIDAAKAASQPAPSKSAPKPKPAAPKPQPSATKTPAPRTLETPSGSAKQPAARAVGQHTRGGNLSATAPELPPGSVVLSPAEMEAVDEALAYYVQHHAKQHR